MKFHAFITLSILLMLFVIYPSITTATTTTNTNTSSYKLFTEFQTVFKRKYKNEQERLTRYKIFHENMEKIEYLNSVDNHQRATYSHLTQWADMTETEFTNMHGYSSSNIDETNTPDTICQLLIPGPHLSPTMKPKASLDYVALGATVAVKNQGKCGSCWAHATTAVVEGRLKIDTGNTTSLSEQYLMDCDTTRVCNGCCGGLPERTLQWLANSTCPGIASEQQYPYESESGTDPTTGKCKSSIPLVAKVTGFGIVNGEASSMLSASNEYGVLSVTMDSKPLQFYKSGIITNPKCTSTGNHAVAIVGYGVDNGVNYWKVRNSYGKQFGEDGYFRIIRSLSGISACGMSGCVVASTGAEYV